MEKWSHLPASYLIKTLKLQQFAHCRYLELSALLCPAGSGILALEKAMAFGHLYVWLVSVQPPNPTTGCRDNILSGQLRVLPTGWHFWQPLIELRVLNYSYRCYGERLPFSQEKLTPPDELWLFIPVSEYSSNDLGLWWLLGQMAAHSLSVHRLKTHTSHCFPSLHEAPKVNQPGFVFLLGQLHGNLLHLAACLSSILHIIMEKYNHLYTSSPFTRSHTH